YPDDCGRRSDGRARGLPRFCKALDSGKGEFVNSVRLTYPMEQGAMRFANLLGKKFSAWRSPGCLGIQSRIPCAAPGYCTVTRIKRSLANRSYFVDFDP